MACAAPSDEIDAGNIRALMNLGGGLLTAFPDAGCSRCAAGAGTPGHHRHPAHRDHRGLDLRLAGQGSAGTPRCDTLGHPEPPVSAQHTDAVVDRPPNDARRGGCWRNRSRLGYSFADTADPDDADPRWCRRGRARGTYADLVANGYEEAPRELPAAVGGAHIDRLGGFGLAARRLGRPAPCRDRTRAARAGAAPPAAPPELAARVPRRARPRSCCTPTTRRRRRRLTASR